MKKITVSDQVRELHDMGMQTKDIAKELGIRYQFAYNVISQYVAAIDLEQKQKANNPIPTKMPELFIAPEAAPIKQVIKEVVLNNPAPIAAPIVTEVADYKMASLPDMPLRARQQEQKASMLQRLFGK